MKQLALLVVLASMIGLWTAAGCSSDSGGADDSGGDTDTDTDTDGDSDSDSDTNPLDDVTFDPEQMISVEITMDAADWQALEDDSRFGPGLSEDDIWAEIEAISEDCSEPWPNEYSWFHAAVSIDGQTLDEVGVRKKGFVGSMYADFPALKLKTNKFVAGQFFGDTERITLNNNSGDPAIMQSCLTFELFRMAGMAAPRCNLADVTVNGEHLGAMTHVEAVKKRFLSYAFGDNTGSLYEGTAVDLVEEWLPRFDVKTDATDETRAPLLAVAQALEASDDQLVAVLEQVLNIDRYITFWALEVIVNHADGYASDRNNFYVYFDPTDSDRGVFVPWGVDKSCYCWGYDMTFEQALSANLPRRLSRIPEMAEAMEAELTRIMTEVWDEAAMLARVDTYEAQLEAVGSNNASEVTSIRNWVQGRSDGILDMVASGVPAGPDQMAECY